ncbi:hypothetical protein [Ralstonia insidiosa]|jgi:hypothetical protein|nr:hypothetical protein [Ralstonia insidiosa]MBA9939341.1 hypothetical protein [Ralstonia insidiosa]MBC9968111.1 hypothetical protein [Ralstonia insidiosa]MBX3904326.1 hypothetical protein [Ralstonia insidiosa]
MIEMNDRAAAIVTVMMAVLILVQSMLAAHLAWLRARIEAKFQARIAEDRKRGPGRHQRQ